MSITVVFGEPGVGKSSLCSYIAKTLYTTSGVRILRNSISKINYLNTKKEYNLTPPNRIPFYSDHEITFKSGYKKTYSTYFINGFYMALENNNFDSIYIPPCSKVFLSEVQRYYDSRKSSEKDKTPDSISRFYEMHRHYDLDFWLDLQRVKLLDLNIRELANKFILVKRLKNVTNSLGVIIQNVWDTYEFSCWNDLEKYLDKGTPTFVKNRYINKGNIFKTFNSCSYSDEFLPSGKKDFIYLEHLPKSKSDKLATSNFYNFDISYGAKKW